MSHSHWSIHNCYYNVILRGALHSYENQLIGVFCISAEFSPLCISKQFPKSGDIFYKSCHVSKFYILCYSIYDSTNSVLQLMAVFAQNGNIHLFQSSTKFVYILVTQSVCKERDQYSNVYSLQYKKNCCTKLIQHLYKPMVLNASTQLRSSQILKEKL